MATILMSSTHDDRNFCVLLFGWFCNEKSDLEAVAYMKIKQLTLELEADSAKEVFPIEKIKNEFTHSKTEKYEMYKFFKCALHFSKDALHFIGDWVKICSTAKSKVQAEFKDLNFAEQCTKSEMVLVSRYEKASSTLSNGNRLFGSITAFIFPLSKYWFSFVNVEPVEVTTNRKPGGVTAPVRTTTLPPSFTTFAAFSPCPAPTKITIISLSTVKFFFDLIIINLTACLVTLLLHWELCMDSAVLNNSVLTTLMRSYNNISTSTCSRQSKRSIAENKLTGAT
ncbi:hypothetical protein Tco_0743458 [Tanacetum coccineum]